MERITILSTTILICCLVTILLVVFGKSGTYVENKNPNNKPIASVPDAIQEYHSGLKGISNPWIFPKDTSYIDTLSKARTSITNYSGLTALTFLSPPQQSLSYKGLYPWSGSPESHFCFDFNSTNLGWYFMYGKTTAFRFTLMIFHIGLNGKNPNRVLYSIVGGCDTGKGWIPIPQNGSPATYSCNGEIVKFAYNNENKKVTTVFNRDASQKITGNFSYPDNENKTINLAFTLTPTKKASYNGKNGGCVPACFGGMGTQYWSYTSPQCTITDNSGTTEGPSASLGWFDHQNLMGGIPRGALSQLAYSFVIGGEVPGSISWLWYTLQLKDRQYMGFVMGIPEDKLPLKENMEFSILLNKYSSNSVEYGIVSKIKIIKITTYILPNAKYTMSFPTTCEFTIPEEKTLTLQSDAKTNKPDVVFMPGGTLNWEGSGTVYDGKTSIGKGFLEGNNLLPNNIINEITKKTAFGSAKISIPNQKPLSSIGKYMTIYIIILMVIFLTVLIILIQQIV